ncbi:M48 family metallopeptidase [Kordiimonas sp. SCSIO 12603]|uniref:M48 family metallopeptidase n=1 Tax=Kordiimonas sp. SCSIO 12603 TaxID=2829596 RepID=UPI0021055EFE|nr:SprT family zinc-dependent metalloprotease [Kordiimonas sp. SCSIO 12603]UTW58654.1 M48 family metallopeptidase [Kordiimonas sp. SCSIO 12603]
MTEVRYLRIGSEDIPLRVRRNAQAKRMTLRVDRTSGDIKVTIPKRISEKAVNQFLNAHMDWIVNERTKLSLEPIKEGMKLPYLGEKRKLVFTGIAPRSVKCLSDEIQVGGPFDMAAGRLEKWFRAQAKEKLEVACRRYADQLEVSYGRISIGDMKSRWGSCSSSGTLRFNWRLVLAPSTVLDYVAAHEVSHLLEMNHSERFWAHVARCMPDFDIQRKWLKREGGGLFSYQFD